MLARRFDADFSCSLRDEISQRNVSTGHLLVQTTHSHHTRQHKQLIDDNYYRVKKS